MDSLQIMHLSQWLKGASILVILILCSFCNAPNVRKVANKDGAIIINGRWLNGEAFEPKSMYVIDGHFSERPPQKITDTIDAQNGFIIPPFAETHNHNIFPIALEATIQNYIDKGVLYSMSQGNTCFSRDSVNSFVNTPKSIDVAFANGGFTSSNGHDVDVNQNLLRRGVFRNKKLADLVNDAYYIVSSLEELEKTWPTFLSCNPDFVKIFLGYSEEFDQRNNNPDFFGHSGINPDLVPAIVKLAHQHNLRVSSHVETAHDFHIAVKSGVDMIAHLPGYQVNDTNEKERFIISDEDARMAKRKGITIISTTRLNYSFQRRDQVLFDFVRDVFKTNLSKLKSAGAKIAIGSDRFGEVSVEEAFNLLEMNLFTKKEILHMWTYTSPKTVFPNRKIGQLKEGYEANFIALKNNPLQDFNAVREVMLRVKKGHILE